MSRYINAHHIIWIGWSQWMQYIYLEIFNLFLNYFQLLLALKYTREILGNSTFPWDQTLYQQQRPTHQTTLKPKDSHSYLLQYIPSTTQHVKTQSHFPNSSGLLTSLVITLISTKKGKEICKFLNNMVTSTLWSAQENTALKSQSRNSATDITENGEGQMNPIHSHLPPIKFHCKNHQPSKSYKRTLRQAKYFHFHQLYLSNATKTGDLLMRSTLKSNN